MRTLPYIQTYRAGLMTLVFLSQLCFAPIVSAQNVTSSFRSWVNKGGQDGLATYGTGWAAVVYPQIVAVSNITANGTDMPISLKLWFKIGNAATSGSVTGTYQVIVNGEIRYEREVTFPSTTSTFIAAGNTTITVKNGDYVRLALVNMATPTSERDVFVSAVYAKCTCDSDPARGDGDADVGNSIDVSIGLDRATEDAPGGGIYLHVSDGNVSYSPSALEIDEPAGSERINVSGVFRQLKTSSVFVNRTNVTNGYKLSFYELDKISITKNGTDSGTAIYTIVSDNPLITWQFEDFDSSGGTKLKVTKTPSGITPTVYEYVWLEDQIASDFNGWKMTVKQNGTALQKKALFEKFSGADKIADKRLQWSGTDTLLSQVDCSYISLGNLTLLSNTTIAPGTAYARTTSYEYWDDSGDEDTYTLLKQVTHGNGRWTYYADYDSQGRVIKRVEQFLSNAFNSGNLTANDEANRVFAYEYDEEVDDGVMEDTEIESLVDTGITKRITRRERWPDEENDVFNKITDAVALPGGLFTESETLKTITYYYNATNNTLKHRAGSPFLVVRPDGTMTHYQYEVSGNDTITIVTTGIGNHSANYTVSFSAGTTSTTLTDPYGQLISREVIDIASNLTIENVVVSEYDEQGRPRVLTYFDGEAGEYSETQEMSCCGLAMTIDRYGVRTEYEYDSLGRLTVRIDYMDGTTDQPDVVNMFDYNGTTKETRVAGTTISSVITNIAGETTSSMAGGRTTSFASNLTFTGGNVAYDQKVTTLPGGAVVEEWHYKDGSLYQRFGAGTHGVRYAYDATTYGFFNVTTVEEVPLIDEDSVVPDVYSLQYTDYAGRTVYSESPEIQSGQGAVETVYVYSESGRLQRKERSGQPGVDYGYDDLGRQNLAEVDATVGAKTTTDAIYEQYSNVTVRKVTTRQYTGNSTYIETIARTRVDGLGSWVVSEGLWTNTTVTVDAGNKTVTTVVTHPDDTHTVTTIINGRTASVEKQDSEELTVTKTTYAYNESGQLASSTDLRNGETAYTYDLAGRVLTVTSPDPGPNNYPMVTDNTYTDLAAGAGTRVVTNITANTVVVATTTKDYYPSGELKSILGAEDYQTEYEYDYAGRVTMITTHPEAGAAQTEFEYSPAGLLVSKSDEGNNTVSYTYWQNGQMKSREWARGATTEYGYTEAGYLANITYSGNLTPNVTYGGHDRLGRPGNVTSALGEGNATVIVNACSYAYNGTVLTIESYTGGVHDGTVLTRTLDGVKRIGNLTVSQGNYTPYHVNYVYNGAGRLENMYWEWLTIQYYYAENSDLIERVTLDDSFVNVLERDMTYDNLNRLTSVTNTPYDDPPMQYAYTYNDRGQRSQAETLYGTGNSSVTERWIYGYDSDGGGNTTKPGQVAAVAKKTTGNVTIPGYSATYAYDGAGNRGNTSVNSGGYSANYTYYDGASASGNIGGSALNQYGSRSVARVVDVLGSANAAATITVSGVTVANGNASQRVGEYWFAQLPVANNTAQMIDVNITASIGGASSSAGGQVYVRSNPENFTYDEDGNLLTDGRWNYFWDGENRLQRVETAAPAYGATPGPGMLRMKIAFTYDDQGRRIARSTCEWNPEAGEGGDWNELGLEGTYFYDGWNVLLGYNGLYVWGLDISGTPQGAGGVGGLLLGKIIPIAGDVTVLYGYDGNGNVVDLVAGDEGDYLGKRYGMYEYDAFGNILAMPHSELGSPYIMAANPFRFSTKNFEYETYTGDPTPGFFGELGLYYYGHRFYNPATGRFLNQDPIGEAGGVNLYAFCGNDGINYVDILGLSEDTYVPDNEKHGEPHIDRYNRQGKNVGRYRPDGTPITHKGTTPPKIPNSDRAKFATALSRLRAGGALTALELAILSQTMPPPDPRRKPSQCTQVKGEPCLWNCKCPQGYLPSGMDASELIDPIRSDRRPTFDCFNGEDAFRQMQYEEMQQFKHQLNA